MPISEVFLKPDNEYIRDINPLKSYHEQASLFIASSFGMPLDEAKKRVANIIKSKIKEPIVKHFTRQENGDRIVDSSPLLTYLNNTVKNNRILAPTLTTYLHPNDKVSILAEFIQENVKIRGKSKKEAQKAKADGNAELYLSKWNEQNNMKIYNNSLSGAFAQGGSVLFNSTAHSTLTSITRSVTSLANSNNEKSLGGNRHYPTQLDLLNNIVYISTKCNTEAIESVIAEYSLHYPTVQEVVSVLRRSSDLYFLDPKFYCNHVIPYLSSISKEQLAGVCYINDMYHIRTFNDSFMRRFLEELAMKIECKEHDISIVDKLKSTDENVLNFVHQIWFTDTKGRGTDYEKMYKIIPNIAANVYYTALHVIETIHKYKSFIKCFLVSDIMPTISNKIRNMLRRIVVISDTDSTCFALDGWVIWYNSFFAINDKTIAIAGAASFLTTQSIPHMLSMLSANINVDKKKLHTLAMKNEYLWTVHMPTEVGKHYAALTVQQEGKVHAEAEMEIKGVHLKNSATPKQIINGGFELMTKILKDTNNNKKLRLTDIVKQIIDVENMIEHSVSTLNEVIYFKKSKIKDASSYKKGPDESPYQRHDMWLKVFEAKYGQIGSPPYSVIKIPVTLDKSTKLVQWVESLDTVIKEPLARWLLNHNKKALPTIYINEEYVLSKGIPQEFIPIINIKKVILDLTLNYRLILGSMGVMLEPNILVREQFPMSLLFQK